MKTKSLNYYTFDKDIVYLVIKVFGKGYIENIIDASDFPLVSQYDWRGSVCPATDKNYLSRILLDVKDSNIIVDHKNGNVHDNRRCNLRLANKSTNAMNSKIRADNTSNVRGVSYSPSRNCWRAYISINGKRVFHKRFKTKQEAIKARELKELSLFNEFSPLICRNEKPTEITL